MTSFATGGRLTRREAIKLAGAACGGVSASLFSGEAKADSEQFDADSGATGGYDLPEYRDREYPEFRDWQGPVHDLLGPSILDLFDVGGAFLKTVETARSSDRMLAIDEDPWRNDDYFRFNPAYSVFEVKGETWGPITVGTISENGVIEEFVSEDIEHVSVSLVGQRLFLGVSLATGLESLILRSTANIEVFLSVYDGQISSGVVFSKTNGIKTTGTGFEVSVRPEFGGASLRNFKSFEEGFKDWVGYYDICVNCP